MKASTSTCPARPMARPSAKAWASASSPMMMAPVAGSVSIGDAQIVEGNNGTQLLNFTVTRSGGTAAFDVNYATSDGTATVADNDYVNVPTTALALQRRRHHEDGLGHDQRRHQGGGQRKLQRQPVRRDQWRAISKGVGVGIITNDDAAPVAGSVSIGDAQIVEGNSGTQLLNFTVTRSGGTAAFDVNYATSDGTATVADNDYVDVPTTALSLQRRRHHEDGLGHDQRRHQGRGQRKLQRQPVRRDQRRDHQQRRGRRHHHQ